MATHAQDTQGRARELPSGWYAFGGALLVVLGSLNMLQGLIALLKDDYFAVTKGGLLFADYSAWGTLFLIIGIIELLVGLGIFALKTWARATGVLLLMLNTIVQFAFIAAFPIWTLAAIIINITAICALMRPLEDYQQPRGYIE
jgi:hypothetical protein